MEFILQGTHGEAISVKDYGQDSYVMTVPVGNGTFKKFVITREQFKRLAKAS
tara:strand:+ start:45 stop:200 length:156 start_codon:yes stop_codon:yes gene_type:complete